MTLVPNLTCARRKRRPMIQQFRNSFLTCCGCAEVPMSKSLGRRPSSRSRTLPPTRYAVKLCSCSRYRTLRASGSMSRREIECSDRATTVGSTIGSIIACYHRGMGPFTSFGPGLRAAILVSIVASTAGAAAKPDFLTAARQFYNQGQYDQALAAAKQAGSIPSTTSSARLIMGRARLERFRDTPAPQELDDARADLRAVDPHALDPRERIELQVGLGELLYLEDHFGPAAELLDPVVDLSATLAPDAHERALDWWATALDRQAQSLPDRKSVV